MRFGSVAYMCPCVPATKFVYASRTSNCATIVRSYVPGTAMASDVDSPRIKDGIIYVSSDSDRTQIGVAV